MSGADIPSLASLTPSPGDDTKLVLVVEDDETLVELFKQLLCDELMCDVLAARDGKQALRLAQTVRISLILLDYLIPGLDGLQVYDALKADPHTEDIPVLFVTAAAKNPVFAASGITDYIEKPFELSDMLERVRSLLYTDAASKPDDRQAANPGTPPDRDMR
jgi:CheY-like chemotaxis protein